MPSNAAPQQKGRIAFDWQIGNFTGWGVFGINLAMSLIRTGGPAPLFLPYTEPALIGDNLLEMFAPLLEEQREIAKHNPRGETYVIDVPKLLSMGNGLLPSFNDFHSAESYGLAFSEDTIIGEDGRHNAAACRKILVGCQWALDVLKANGIDNGMIWRQGVNPADFPLSDRRRGDKFNILLAGQLSYRKGHDIALAAIKPFLARHPDAHVILACQSAWPQWANGLGIAGHMQGDPAINAQTNRLEIGPWLVANGFPAERFTVLDFVPNHDLHKVLAEIDVALFTNRAEASTNQIAAECMSTGVPVVLSANTGHLDHDRPGVFMLRDQGRVKGHPMYVGTYGWGESDPEEAICALEEVYGLGDMARVAAMEASEVVRTQWTWDRRAVELAEIIGAKA